MEESRSMRGPMVFCIEGADVAGGKVGDLVLKDDAPLATEFREDLLSGVQVITGIAERVDSKDKTIADKSVAFTAIPYFAWANRGKGEMVVWLPRTPEAVGEEP